MSKENKGFTELQSYDKNLINKIESAFNKTNLVGISGLGIIFNYSISTECIANENGESYEVNQNIRIELINNPECIPERITWIDLI